MTTPEWCWLACTFLGWRLVFIPSTFVEAKLNVNCFPLFAMFYNLYGTFRGTTKGYYPAQIKTKSSANKIFQTKKLSQRIWADLLTPSTNYFRKHIKIKS